MNSRSCQQAGAGAGMERPIQSNTLPPNIILYKVKGI